MPRNPDDDSIAHKERGRETHRQRLSSRRRRKRFARFSSQRARDHSSSSSSFCGVPKAHSFKVSSFFSSLLRESKVPCSVCGRFRRRRHQNCSCCLFCFAVKVVFKVPFVGKNAIHNGGDDSDGVIQKEKKTMTSYDLRQSRLVSLSKGLSLSQWCLFFGPNKGK